ncbi:MAG: 30S ribosome-binding factor RbfA [Dehalococcoidia bacterium]|nr:30S ribosome-binding factor RbfA [Dehalococcoidia bacterium]
MTRRTERVNEALREEISNLLLRETRDPRLAHIVSITAVEVASDLKCAKVFVSVLGTEEDKKEVMVGLQSAANFLRRALTSRLRLRHIPVLNFRRDDSIERGSRILQLLKEIGPEE